MMTIDSMKMLERFSHGEASNWETEEIKKHLVKNPWDIDLVMDKIMDKYAKYMPLDDYSERPSVNLIGNLDRLWDELHEEKDLKSDRDERRFSFKTDK